MRAAASDPLRRRQPDWEFDNTVPARIGAGRTEWKSVLLCRARPSHRAGDDLSRTPNRM